MLRHICLLFALALLQAPLFSQQVNLKLEEKQLQLLFVELNETHEQDSINIRIQQKLNTLLQSFESFQYPFDSLKHVGKIKSPDGTFRIIQWNIPYKNGTNAYYGFIQIPIKKEHKCKVYLLKHISEPAEVIEKTTYTNENWPGALYYEIIPVKSNGKKYYTLLGFDFNSELITHKVIDILYFNNDGTAVFGAPLFKEKNQIKNRIVFQFSAQAKMMLRYDKKTKMIVYDHLSPAQSKYTGNYQFYGPDFSYDAFIFKDGLWNYKADVVLKNSKPTPKAKPNKQPGIETKN